MQRTFQIKNLDCAACAAELQEELEAIEGIGEPSVDFINQRVSLSYADQNALKKAIDTISHFEEVEIVENRRVIQIKNLDCAACAAELQEELEAIEGIGEPSVDFINQRVSLSYADQNALKKAIDTISHFEEVEIVDGGTAAAEKKERHLKELISIAVSALFFIPAFVLDLIGGVNEWLLLGLYLCAFAAAGWSVIYSVVKNIGKAFKTLRFGTLLDENLLMLIAAIGAFAIGQEMEGAIVMLLYQIGEYLQAIAVGSSRGAITKLMELKSESAILLEGDSQREVAPEELRAGDCILIRKGDKVPADCVLTDEATELDTKSLTGESYLREIVRGEEMLAGCVNEGNAVKAEVLRPSSESAVAKILNMVENSATKKAKPEKFITKFARVYTPVVVLIALIVAVLPPLILGMNDSARWSNWISRALNFLVISCPCALIISVPLTYFSGVGTLARYGVLAKGAVYLDMLAKVKVAVFDKTGTLTKGRFSIAKINGERRTVELAAAVEKNSSHPLAQAFAEIQTSLSVTDCAEVAGMGLSAVSEGKRVLVGSARLMREYGVPFEEASSSSSVVYVAEDGKLVGSIEIEDALREEAGTVLADLKAGGIEKTAVLTGDSRARAVQALKGLPIDEIHADLLPGQKIECAQKLKNDGKMMYVGDGINDTPVMAESDISVSMGALGSDAAIEASDLVLAGDNLNALPKALKGAKKTRAIVTQNIVFSIAVKVALMVLSLVGLIPLWAAVLGDVGVMLLAVLNSLRMRAKIK